MKLLFDFSIYDLYSNFRLEQLHSIFLQFYKDSSEDIKNLDLQESLLKRSVILEKFLSHFFNIEDNVQLLQKQLHDYYFVSFTRKNFIQKRVLIKYKNVKIDMEPNTPFDTLSEYDAAKLIQLWLSDEYKYKNEIEQAELYCAFHLSQQIPHPIFPTLLWKSAPLNHLDLLTESQHSYHHVQNDHLINDPSIYGLKNHLPTQMQEINQAEYCIHCHAQKKDSCRTGLRVLSGELKENPLHQKLEGCPLDQKISEMNMMFSKGYSIAALAIAMIDNPLLAATGHRICVDCRQACIFQKQTQVDVPGIETQILESVLNLPYGPEIYSLLTRWNPLNEVQPLPFPSKNEKVLIVGAGPSGFTLAHYLLREGVTVALVDTAKIEPLDISWTESKRSDFKVMKSWKEMQKSLYQRIPQGFGGVCEYGITSRWNKNYLDLIRLILERQSNFSLAGGLRFGGALDFEQAFSMGFDHVALCLGAGLSKGLRPEWMKISGVHFATDFLMTLHLGAAYHRKSLFQFKLQLPIVVLGGGLTAVDCAVEARSFYVQQVLKFKHRYDFLKTSMTDQEIRKDWTESESALADTYLFQSSALEDIDLETNLSKIHSLIDEWGGVTLLYRKNITQAPAYKINVDELKYALREGIKVIYDEEVLDIKADEQGYLEAIQTTERTLLCKTLLLGTGLKPNVSIEKDTDCLVVLGDYLKRIDGADYNNPLLEVKNFEYQNKISCFGDLNPYYHGSVVKAIASAKEGYPYVLRSLEQNNELQTYESSSLFLDQWKSLTSVYVQGIEKNEYWVEIKIYAPLQAQSYKAGHIYKLNQYFASNLKQLDMYAEGVVLSPIHVDETSLTFIVHQAGASSCALRYLSLNEHVSLTGPSGDVFTVYENQTVVLVALSQTLAGILIYRERLLEKGCKVLLIVVLYSHQDHEIFQLFKEDYAKGWMENEDYVLAYLSHLSKTLDNIVSNNANDMQWKIHGSNDLNDIVIQELKRIYDQDYSVRINYSVFNSVQCISKGICSRCIYYKEGSDQPLYACMCYQQTANINEDKNPLILRDQSHSPLNKIDYLYVRKKYPS